MDIKQIHESLQTSGLAPLFLDLTKPEIKEEKDSVVVRLKLKSPMPDDEARLVIVDNNGIIRFLIPQIATSKEYSALARCGDVNHMVCIGKLCWDPQDGEISAEWSLPKDKGQDLTPELVEYVVANLLRVFMREKIILATIIAKAAGLQETLLRPMMDACRKKAKEEFEPCIEEVLGE